MTTTSIVKRLYQYGEKIHRHRRDNCINYEGTLPKYVVNTPAVRVYLLAILAAMKSTGHIYVLAKGTDGHIRVTVALYRDKMPADEWDEIDSDELKRGYADDIAF